LTSDKLNQYLVRKGSAIKQWVTSKLAAKSTSTAGSAAAAATTTGAATANPALDVIDAGSIHHARYIERINLQTMELSLSSIFSPTKMQEPTYERVIVLYRPKQPAVLPTGHVPPIFIKQFKTIPMAGTCARRRCTTL